MERMWVFALLFLFLCNAFDVLATCVGVRNHGYGAEQNEDARRIMTNHGLKGFLLWAICILGGVKFLVVLSLWLVHSVLFGFLCGSVVASLFSLHLGTVNLVSGLTWLTEGAAYHTCYSLRRWLGRLTIPALVLSPLLSIFLWIMGRGAGSLVGMLLRP